MVRFYSHLAPVPEIDAYRLTYSPQAHVAPIFICPFVVVTGDSGRTYQAMRGIQGIRTGAVINYGIYELNGELDEQGPLLYGYDEVPALDRFWIQESSHYISYIGDAFRFDFGINDYKWMDANERVSLQATRIGQPYYYGVPSQNGFDVPLLVRTDTARVTGTVGDDPVDGLMMLDYVFSTPGVEFRNVGLLDKLHNLWMNWLVEYEDGSYEGGLAWRGRPGTGFSPAHHIVDGNSTARMDAVIHTETTERGTISAIELILGDLTVNFEQIGSCDWPLHTCGVVTTTSRSKTIARSWNYTEYLPLNFGDFMAYREAYEKLYGRPASFSGILDEAVVRDGRLIFGER